MGKLQEVIQDYEEKRIPLDELQEFIWGLLENILETIPEDILNYCLWWAKCIIFLCKTILLLK